MALNFAALCMVIALHAGWQVMALLTILLAIAFYVYRNVSQLLFRSASITSYWRPDTGGQPDIDDPYDLRIPLECMNKKAQDAMDLAQYEVVQEQWHTVEVD